MSVKRYNFDGNADGYFDDPFMKLRDNGKFILHSDYSALLSSHNALVEAVVWDRECEDFDRWADAMRRAWSCEWDDVVHSARAEVDRLLKEEL